MDMIQMVYISLCSIWEGNADKLKVLEKQIYSTHNESTKRMKYA